MTCSINSLSAGNVSYYTHLAREDYYTKGGEAPGRWSGEGADLLGLRGSVDKETLHNLFNGLDPTGKEKLRQNALEPPRTVTYTDLETGEEKTKTKEHVAGYDATFSAPKTVSALWAVAGRDEVKAIEAAHREGVQAALKYLHEYEAYCRLGKNGCDRAKAHLIVAEFDHGTSRDLDPQLHTHALICNIGVMEDGKTATLDGRLLYRAQRTAGAIYHAVMAKSLEETLGVATERTKDAFEVVGVSPELCDRWSTRRQEIEAWCDRRGVSTKDAGSQAALDTRARKQDVSRKELVARWRETAKEYGFSPASVPTPYPHREWQTAVSEAQTHADTTLTEQHSTFAARDVFRRVAEGGAVMGYEEVKAVAEHYLQSPQAISVGERRGEAAFTSPQMLALEGEILTRVRAGREDRSHEVSRRSLDIAMRHHPELNAEQRHAIAWIAATRGNVKVMSGLAGTGKSTTLNVAREIWEGEGYHITGLSLSAVAAKGLEKSAGIESHTVAKFLKEQTPPPSRQRGDHRHEAERDKWALTNRSIVVVDESAMVGTRDMHKLVSAVDKAGAKLILVGDPKQLQPIEAGGVHKALSSQIGEAKLETIVRQRHEWARDAVREMAQGKVENALKAYASRGLLFLADDRQTAAELLIADWKAQGGIAAPKDHLIVASTRAEVRALNREAQAARYMAGALGHRSVAHDGERFYEGDRVIFLENDRRLGVQNGSRATITHVSAAQHIVVASLDGSDRRITFSLCDYDRVSLGYAATTHKSQGATAERAYVLCGGDMQHRELSYVQLSRTREETRLYTDRIVAGEGASELVAQMERSREKEMATPAHQLSDRRVPNASATLVL